MKKMLTMLAGCGILMMAGSVHAQIFVCKDASGRTLTADRPIPECADRPQRVLGKNGLTQREILPPPTAEERRHKEEQEKKRKAERALAEEQKRQDNALLARYRTEQDIEVARKRTLDQLQEQIKREELALALSEKRLKEALSEADVQKKGKGISANLQRRIEDTEQSVKDGKQTLVDRQTEFASINAKFDQSVKRFRELSVTNDASAATTTAESAK